MYEGQWNIKFAIHSLHFYFLFDFSSTLSSSCAFFRRYWEVESASVCPDTLNGYFSGESYVISSAVPLKIVNTINKEENNWGLMQS